MVTDICLKYILSICFLSWLHYYSMLALHDRPVLEMVSLLFLELYQLLQHSYDCSSVMSVHLKGGGSTRDTRVSLTSVDMVSRLAKSCWMSTISTVCRGSRQVVTTLFEPFNNPPCSDWIEHILELSACISWSIPSARSIMAT